MMLLYKITKNVDHKTGNFPILKPNDVKKSFFLSYDTQKRNS
jgi:hypothetical protein